MLVGLNGGGKGATCLQLVFFTLQLKCLVLNKGNTSQFSCFVGSDPILQVFHHLP